MTNTIKSDFDKHPVFEKFNAFVETQFSEAERELVLSACRNEFGIEGENALTKRYPGVEGNTVGLYVFTTEENLFVVSVSVISADGSITFSHSSTESPKHAYVGGFSVSVTDGSSLRFEVDDIGENKAFYTGTLDEGKIDWFDFDLLKERGIGDHEGCLDISYTQDVGEYTPILDGLKSLIDANITNRGEAL